VPRVGKARVAVLFVDFPDAQAPYSTQQEAEGSLPYMEEYLEAASYGKLDVEVIPLHKWLRTEHSYTRYIGTASTDFWPEIDITEEAVRLAEPTFDFTGVDALMVVRPSSLFFGANAGGNVMTEEESILETSRIGTGLRSEPENEPVPWGLTGAHEIAHNLGLLDMYAYHAAIPHPPPGSDETYVHFVVGLMGLRVTFPVTDDPRLHFTEVHPDGTYTAPDTLFEANEMLSWSRWQLGWLNPDQIRCLAGLETETTVTISPVASPTNHPAMIAIPISDTKALVIESRRKLGYDANFEEHLEQGIRRVRTPLPGEGILVYTVDATIPTGHLPFHIAGDSDRHVENNPILTEGQTLKTMGYTITVEASAPRTDTITITKTTPHTATGRTGNGYSDVSGIHEPAINTLASRHILSGTDCGQRLFCPQKPIKRWVMAVWLTRALGKTPDPTQDASRFSDVDPQQWWAPYVEQLANLGITKGCATDPLRYCPQSTVTRGEMATLLTRLTRLTRATKSPN